MRDGREIVVRAVRDGDRDGFQAALRRMSEQSRYSRFLSPVKELSPQLLERGDALVTVDDQIPAAGFDDDDGRLLAAFSQ